MNEQSQHPETPAAALEVVEEATVSSQLEAIERAAIDVQIATAHRFPRSMAEFKRKALDMVSLDVETAASCIYRRNVGKERNDAGQMEDKFAEGMSIRMAEIVGACYGNLRVMSMIVEQTPTFVKCRAVAHDLESNYLAASEAIESTTYKSGDPFPPRLRILIAKATLAKAHRDATFKVVPRALCKTIMAKAIEVESGGRTLGDRRASAHEWIKSLKIDEARVWAVLQVKGLADLQNEHLVTLLGLRTALIDSEATLDETFPPISPENPAPDVPAGSRPEPARRGRKPAAQQEAAATAATPAPAAQQAPATAPATQTPPPAPPAPQEAAAAPAQATPDPKAQTRKAEPPFQPVLTALKEGEKITCTGCTLVEAVARRLAGKASVVVELKGGFNGVAYHIGGAADTAEGLVPDAVWDLNNKLTVSLLSRRLRNESDADTTVRCIAVVEKVVIEAPAQQSGLSL